MLKRRKKLFLSVVLLTLTFLVVGCLGDDGVAYGYIGFDDPDTQYLRVTDASFDNNIYIDEAGSTVYCGSGPNEVISLPESIIWASSSSYDQVIEYDVEAVCMLGQDVFDEILVLLGVEN